MGDTHTQIDFERPHSLGACLLPVPLVVLLVSALRFKKPLPAWWQTDTKGCLLAGTCCPSILVECGCMSLCVARPILFQVSAPWLYILAFPNRDIRICGIRHKDPELFSSGLMETSPLYSAKCVEVCFMTQKVVCLNECSMWIWEECVFCCCFTKSSINATWIQLTMVPVFRISPAPALVAVVCLLLTLLNKTLDPSSASCLDTVVSPQLPARSGRWQRYQSLHVLRVQSIKFSWRQDIATFPGLS